MKDREQLLQCLSDARLALNEAEALLTKQEEAPLDSWMVQDYGVYVYRDPNLKRSDPNSIVYVGNGKADRPWEPHSNAIAKNFEMDCKIEVLVDGLDGMTAEAIEYGLIEKYQPHYNLVRMEPGIINQAGCDGPWRIVAFKNFVEVAQSKKTRTSVGNIEALYTSSYGNNYKSGGKPFPHLKAGIDYDACRIRIGDS